MYADRATIDHFVQLVYKGVSLSDVLNQVYTFGYTRGARQLELVEFEISELQKELDRLKETK